MPEEITDRDRETIRKALGYPLYYPREFVKWISDRPALAGIDVPVSQLIGFPGFLPQEAQKVITSQTTTSTSYTDLATVGPEITGLPAGKYEVKFGAAMKTTSNEAYMNVGINGAGPANDDDAIIAIATAAAGAGWSCAGIFVVDLSEEGGNTLTAKYKVTAGTGTFSRRFLIATKVQNP